MTPAEFKSDESRRKDLKAILSHPTFREALDILREERETSDAFVEAQCIGSDTMPTVRRHSQHVGIINLMVGLRDLAEPPYVQPKDPEATFGQDEAYHKLHQPEQEQ